MSKEYDQTTAFHYSAFRPPLHKVILNQCTSLNKKYEIGLDVGCGTGQSSIALTHYCQKVIGIEPSQEMFKKSIKHSRVEYVHGNCETAPFDNSSFDIITFAGSLFYGKSQKLLDKILRISKPTADIVIYDFEVALDIFLSKLGVDCSVKKMSEYNHKTDFSGLNQQDMRIIEKLEEPTFIEITHPDLAHLLLSSKLDYDLLLNQFGYDRLFEKVLQKLNSVLKANSSRVHAMCYSTVYRKGNGQPDQ